MRPIDAEALLLSLFSVGWYDDKDRDIAWELITKQPTVDAKPVEPLTLDELRDEARQGNAVWCVDTDGVSAGLLCYTDCVLDDGKEAHIWLLDEEGNAHQYNAGYMIEGGAKFYRRKPERHKENTK